MIPLKQTSGFVKTYKKLKSNQRDAVNKALQQIQENPLIGEQKKWDIQGIRVYKFRMVNQLVLLAYRNNVTENYIALYDVGPHENFYRDLKKN